MTSKLLLAGCGKMGSALLAGWLEGGTDASSITVVEPDKDTAGRLQTDLGVTVESSLDTVADAPHPAVVVFAVKPQMMDAVAPAYRRFVGPGTVFLTIAAGKTIGAFEHYLGDAAIVRSMPNTPAAVGRGITVACANGHVTADQRQVCDGLLKAVGAVAWVEDENLLDAVTALSGSGPAYVFLFVESLTEAGIEAGLPADLARQLARATVAGAGELLHQSPEDAAQLRQNVTSPGGTTAAALDILMGESGWQSVINEAIEAATRRSRELAD